MIEQGMIEAELCTKFRKYANSLDCFPTMKFSTAFCIKNEGRQSLRIDIQMYVSNM